MLAELEGRVAVVTGGGSGIGAALCRRFAAEGMRVVVADVDGAAAQDVASAVGPPATAEAVDVADRNAVLDLADRCFARGPVDLLCLNAGVFQGGLSWARTAEDWSWTYGVNVFGVVHGIGAFVPRMLEQGTDGHVVVTASVAAFVSGAFSAPYVSSKAAAASIAECLAHDLAAVDARIGASLLVPSAFDTGIAESARVRPDALGRDDSEDGAATLAFLADATGAGLAPDAIGDPVVEAVRSGTFLIPTRPSYRAQLANRHDRLAERRLPGDVVVD